VSLELPPGKGRQLDVERRQSFLSTSGVETHQRQLSRSNLTTLVSVKSLEPPLDKVTGKCW